MDFVHDRFADGRPFRVLRLLDSRRVTRTLYEVIAERGKPESVRLFQTNSPNPA